MARDNLAYWKQVTVGNGNAGSSAAATAGSLFKAAMDNLSTAVDPLIRDQQQKNQSLQKSIDTQKRLDTQVQLQRERIAAQEKAAARKRRASRSRGKGSSRKKSSVVALNVGSKKKTKVTSKPNKQKQKVQDDLSLILASASEAASAPNQKSANKTLALKMADSADEQVGLDVAATMSEPNIDYSNEQAIDYNNQPTSQVARIINNDMVTQAAQDTSSKIDHLQNMLGKGILSPKEYANEIRSVVKEQQTFDRIPEKSYSQILSENKIPKDTNYVDPLDNMATNLSSKDLMISMGMNDTTGSNLSPDFSSEASWNKYSNNIDTNLRNALPTTDSNPYEQQFKENPFDKNNLNANFQNIDPQTTASIADAIRRGDLTGEELVKSMQEMNASRPFQENLMDALGNSVDNKLGKFATFKDGELKMVEPTTAQKKSIDSKTKSTKINLISPELKPVVTNLQAKIVEYTQLNKIYNKQTAAGSKSAKNAKFLKDNTQKEIVQLASKIESGVLNTLSELQAEDKLTHDAVKKARHTLQKLNISLGSISSLKFSKSLDAYDAKIKAEKLRQENISGKTGKMKKLTTEEFKALPKEDQEAYRFSQKFGKRIYEINKSSTPEADALSSTKTIQQQFNLGPEDANTINTISRSMSTIGKSILFANMENSDGGMIDHELIGKNELAADGSNYLEGPSGLGEIFLKNNFSGNAKLNTGTKKLFVAWVKQKPEVLSQFLDDDIVGDAIMSDKILEDILYKRGFSKKKRK